VNHRGSSSSDNTLASPTRRRSENYEQAIRRHDSVSLSLSLLVQSVSDPCKFTNHSFSEKELAKQNHTKSKHFGSWGLETFRTDGVRSRDGKWYNFQSAPVL
jgi:hypothetical protein